MILKNLVRRSAPHVSLIFMCAVLMVAMANPCLADFDGSLRNIKDELTGVILPLLSVIGLGLSAVSFFTGNPQAKTHVFYAILGCILSFGAQAIVDLIKNTVH